MSVQIQSYKVFSTAFDRCASSATALAFRGSQKKALPLSLWERKSENTIDYSNLLHSTPTPSVSPELQVLQKYRGTVDFIKGDLVDLTLEDEYGALSSAKMTAKQMADLGLSLMEDFYCTVTKQGSDVKVSFEPIPRQYSLEASALLRDDIKAAYQDFDDDF